jgi:hypothetical protein
MLLIYNNVIQYESKAEILLSSLTGNNICAHSSFMWVYEHKNKWLHYIKLQQWQVLSLQQSHYTATKGNGLEWNNYIKGCIQAKLQQSTTDH